MYRVFSIVILNLALCAQSVRASEVRVGDTLPIVELHDWKGQPVTLAGPRSGVTVVDFWASWCATCRTALPALDAIARRHTNGVTFAAVNIDKNQSKADQFLAEHLPHPTMTLLRDPDGAAMAHFGAAGMPALYIIDGSGIVRFAASGYSPDKLVAVEEAITNLLNGSSAE